jgi:hypothetical protein
MTEQELRAMVREAIARQKGSATHDQPGWAILNPDPCYAHASHGQFAVPGGSDACIIEPAVPCSHCGYCKSYGH